MFDKWLRLPAHLYLRITALTILTVGIAVSNVLMSIGTIWLVANWLIQADFKIYWNNLKKNRTAWYILGIYLFLSISILWSNDVAYGLKDLRIKLPFIVIPLVMATSEPLSKKHFYFLLYIFLGTIAYTSAYNFIHYNYVSDQQNDIREMSVFISHVRFSILINFAFFTSVLLIYKKKMNRLIGLVFMGWFLFYLYKSQIINGYILFTILSGLLILLFLLKLKSRTLKISVFTTILIVIVGGVFLMSKEIGKMNTCAHIEFDELDFYSVNNNPYYHDTTNKQVENGHYVWLYVTEIELKREWEKRSEIRYDSLDRKGQPIYGTLMRYLTSKGYRKDSVGVNKLTIAEVSDIENGQTSSVLNKGIFTRVNVFLMEYRIYQEGGDPNGHSLMQRVEHLKAAVQIIKSNRWLGVGAGDVAETFKSQYHQMKSRLNEEHQHRSHNQFLTIWVTLGILGLILFLLLFISPFINYKSKDYFMIMVIVGLFVSSLFQDMIETQAGVTIFALFYSLAIYGGQSTKETI